MAFLNRDNTGSSNGVSSYPNDFDLAFAEPSSPRQTLHVPQGAQPWLDLWVLQNPLRLPSQKEATSLAILTGACESQIMAWIEPHLSKDSRPESSDTVEPSETMPKAYRPKCIDSRWRYRYRGPQEDATKTFECTHRCGQSFPRQRKGDGGTPRARQLRRMDLPHLPRRPEPQGEAARPPQRLPWLMRYGTG